MVNAIVEIHKLDFGNVFLLTQFSYKVP